MSSKKIRSILGFKYSYLCYKFGGLILITAMLMGASLTQSHAGGNDLTLEERMDRLERDLREAKTGISSFIVTTFSFKGPIMLFRGKILSSFITVLKNLSTSAVRSFRAKYFKSSAEISL